MNKPITVLLSGQGSTLAAILAAIDRRELNAKVVRIIADRDCKGLAQARARTIPHAIIDRKLPPAARSAALLTAIPPDSELIVLAGYLSAIPPALVDQYPRKIINIHPSLLPKFGGLGMYGIHVHRAVIQAGEQQSGCTVHYVDHGIDSGEIIAQTTVEVNENDSPETLQQRIQQHEQPLLIHTIQQLLHP